jgi:hypothetical protein
VIGAAINATTCCTPVIEGPAQAMESKKYKFASNVRLVLHAISIVSLAGVNEFWPQGESASFSIRPPIDAVIVFQRLTI